MENTNTDARKAAREILNKTFSKGYSERAQRFVTEERAIDAMLEFAQSRPATLDKRVVSDEELEKAAKPFDDEFGDKEGFDSSYYGFKAGVKWRESLSEQREAEKQLKITCPDCNGTGYEGGTVRLRGGSDCKTCKAFGEIDAPKPTESERAGKWISIEEELPQIDQIVILKDENRFVNCHFELHWHGVGYLENACCPRDYWTIIGENRAQTLNSVTHWMPMPSTL